MRTIKALSNGLPKVFLVAASNITRVTRYYVQSWVITDPGSGYSVGDIGDTEDGADIITPARFQVVNVSPAGVVQELALLDPGMFSLGAAPSVRTIAAGDENMTVTITCRPFALVTVTTAKAHRLVTGQKVRINIASSESVAKQNLYKGDYIVTVTSPTAFTFRHTDSATTALDAVNSLTVQGYVDAMKDYNPFAVVREGRLQTEESVPDASLWVADTDSHSGTWRKITALEATVIDTLTSTTLSNGPNAAGAAGLKLPVGREIRGAFTTVKLNSGSVLLDE